MKTMNGWKVITTNRMSVTEKANPLALEYPVNEEVFSKNPKAKLFFFDNKHAANRFAKKMTSQWGNNIKCIVVKCNVTNATIPRKEICSCWYDIDRYWGGNCIDITDWLAMPPSGTWLADSVTCLE